MRCYGIVILFFVAVHFHHAHSKITLEQAKNMISKFKDGCQKKTGVTDDVISARLNGVFEPSLGCFNKCVFKALNAFKNDKINTVSLLKQINAMLQPEIAGRVAELTNLCYEESAPVEDPCEHALAFAKCYWRIDPDLYMFP